VINTETTKKENHISRPIAARSFVFVTCSQLSPTGVSFPPARFACFFSRVHSRTARGGRRSSSLSLCVERHPRLWMCVSTSARIIIRRRRPGAGTRVDKGYIYRASSHFRRVPEKFYYYYYSCVASLFIQCQIGVRVDVFLFCVSLFQKHSQSTFKKDMH